MKKHFGNLENLFQRQKDFSQKFESLDWKKFFNDNFFLNNFSSIFSNG